MTTKNKLLIIGAGGHGKVVADIALKMKRWKEVSFLDNKSNIEPFMNCHVIDKSSEAIRYIKDYDIIVAVGNNAVREKILTSLENEGASIPVLIHPRAVIGEQVEIGNGTVVMAGVVINCSTRIGRGCIINTSSSIDHDNKVEDYVHISPGVHLAGTVEIGKKSWIGIGATISNNINVAENCVVGAGAVVVANIVEGGTYIGVPIRKLRQ